MVVAWTHQDGIQNAHCLKCFFDIKKAIASKKEKYLNRYGLVPTFKAGVHLGNVIAGEIGIIKRDITYSGDVLNTTSRILGKCSELKEEVIVSADLFNLLHSAKEFGSKVLGDISLKGKERQVAILSLFQKESDSLVS